MAQADILAAAAAIAAKLTTLPEINVCFDHAKPISAMEHGDAMLALTGTSPPDTFEGLQTTIWSCVVKLGSAMVDVDGGVQLARRLAGLMSSAPGEGIIGILRASPDLYTHGEPRVTEDGCEAIYDDEMDENLLTLVQCSISANLPV